MKLLKNNVGRPSNDTLRKRKFICIAIAIITLLIVGGTGFTLYRYTTGINAKQRNASADNCRMPYSSSKCLLARNETIKNVQKMLNKLGYYKKIYGFDGNYGPKTVTAVKTFQKKYGLDVDGYIGPGTLEALAKATNTEYFKIIYNKNGGSGNLNSQYGNTQTIIKGVSTPMSSTKLSKNGKTHVGYTATSIVNGVEYIYGCFNANCVSGQQTRHSVASIKKEEKAGSTFYNYVFPVGTTLKNTAKNGQTVTMTAFYCSSGETYNQKTSKCVKSSTTSSSGSYNKTGTLTGYNGFCIGCSGKTACNAYDVRKNLTYKDSKYGNVRVVAMSKTYKCGTIIEIQSLVDGKTQNAVKAIVLDRGGAITGNKIDLLSLDDAKTINKEIGKQTVNFKVLRNGW